MDAETNPLLSLSGFCGSSLFSRPAVGAGGGLSIGVPVTAQWAGLPRPCGGVPQPTTRDPLIPAPSRA